MGKCTVCGERAEPMMLMCPACIDKQPVEDGEQIQAASGTEVTTPTSTRLFGYDKEKLCIGIGVGFMLLGVFFLLISPSVGEAFGSPVVNLQRLYIGQTSAIIGAIFMAVGIRPR